MKSVFGVAVLLAAASSCLGLIGCAGSGADGRSALEPSVDIVTESDEPEARKRARLRIELATGYFEQGQTTVALDEIKQSLAADSGYGPAFNLRGLVYMRLNDRRMAEDSFRRALSINPRDADVAHNLAWLYCQNNRLSEALPMFAQALASPVYAGRAKSWMAQGICLARAGRSDEAEASLLRSYELDAGNPVTGYTLSQLLYRKADYLKAQFYIRRLNNSELANAETLWLGIRTERRLNNIEAMRQLADQLKRRFPQSQELTMYVRGVFDE